VPIHPREYFGKVKVCSLFFILLEILPPEAPLPLHLLRKMKAIGCGLF
jgi:hypothetical protein